ncbi:MAG: hypothetical protein RBS96_09035 [Dehalococcoidales bacterium]|jgi:ribosomal protein L37E|nr:hypothetical protein [Dehalococcoidales bacterium]
METCRNCGHKTLATLDWACPWCGFPLKKGKRLDVTYSQAVKLRRIPETDYLESLEGDIQPTSLASGAPFKEKGNSHLSLDEHSDEPVLVSQDEEEFQVMTAKLNVFDEKPPFREDETGKDVEINGNTETVEEGGASNWEELMESVPGVFGTSETVETLQSHSASVEEPAGEMVNEPEIAEEEPQNEEAIAYMPGSGLEQEEQGSGIEQEPETVAAIDITIEELMEAYQQDDEAADERYNDKLIALTGVVALANVRDDRDFQYVTVTGKDQNIFRSIKCVFNMDKAFQLKRLERGQTVVISGRFRGSLTSMSLVDCSVIQVF